MALVAHYLFLIITALTKPQEHTIYKTCEYHLMSTELRYIKTKHAALVTCSVWDVEVKYSNT